jgi:hypothetical protein
MQRLISTPAAAAAIFIFQEQFFNPPDLLPFFS